MGTGILLCGLNGAGKTTLGQFLAQKSTYSFIDSEEFCFSKTDPDNPYASPRARREVEARLFREIQRHEHVILASVTWDYRQAASSFFRCVVWMKAPKEIRLQRVKARSFETFGNRMLPGGDLHEQEKRFFDMVGSRTENALEEGLRSLGCPIIRVDGTKPVAENAELILRRMPNEMLLKGAADYEQI